MMNSKQGNFNLTKKFSLLSFFCILIIGTVATFTMSLFFTTKILNREATVSKEFIESIIAADGTWSLFQNTQLDDIESSTLKLFFSHVANMPDVVRANIYGSNKSVLWSSAPELIGNHFQNNPELDTALKGELVYKSSIIDDIKKAEHMFLEKDTLGIRFIETYIPIWNRDRSAVVGVAELYKVPRTLHQSIIQGQQLIWIIALIGGLLLFTSLYWIVTRASYVMENQQRQLIENKSLSMIGQTASAIIHAMRNPLASIRACAELTLSDDLEGARESALDIIGEADRLDRWARELLQFSATNTATPDNIDLNEMIKDVLKEYEPTLKKLSTIVRLNLTGTQLLVQTHYAPLSQVIGSLLMNAVEAMGENGELAITTAYLPHSKSVTVTITDNGPGLPKEIKENLFRPFTTTKPTGIGLGLPLSRHLLEHYGGILEIASKSGQGVTATVRLSASEVML